jgi:hypothetical protein
MNRKIDCDFVFWLNTTVFADEPRPAIASTPNGGVTAAHFDFKRKK